MRPEQRQPFNVHSNERNQSGCCGKMSPCTKCCIGSCVCAVVVAAVMIPVGIFVIAPKVAQHIMDQTLVALPNSTMSPCLTLESWIENSAVITLKSPLPIMPVTTLHPYKQVLNTTTCMLSDGMHGGFECGSNATSTLLGTYSSPEMTLNKGDNHKNFSVRMDLNDSTTIISGFILPMLMPPHGNKARLILTAEDVSISVLGFKISGLTMRNELTCTGEAIMPAVDIPNEICYPNDPTKKPYNAGGYTMSCVPGDLSLTTTTTTTTKPKSLGNADVVV